MRTSCVRMYVNRHASHIPYIVDMPKSTGTVNKKTSYNKSRRGTYGQLLPAAYKLTGKCGLLKYQCCGAGDSGVSMHVLLKALHSQCLTKKHIRSQYRVIKGYVQGLYKS